MTTITTSRQSTDGSVGVSIDTKRGQVLLILRNADGNEICRASMPSAEGMTISRMLVTSAKLAAKAGAKLEDRS